MDNHDDDEFLKHLIEKTNETENAIRELATFLGMFYKSFVEAGFSQGQAMALVRDVFHRLNMQVFPLPGGDQNE